MFEKMITSTFLAVYFAATIGAIALATGLAPQSVLAGKSPRAAQATVITLERVVVHGERIALAAQAPEQATLVR